MQFFHCLANRQNMRLFLSSANKDNENAREASYCIIYCIANGKNHTVAENLISPCVKDAVLCMFGEEHVRKMDTIPLLKIQYLKEFTICLTMLRRQ